MPALTDTLTGGLDVCFVPIADARQVTGKYFVGTGQEASLGPGRIGRNPKAISPLTPIKGNNSP